ncbi:delta-lactam-biosynthetic de-N-acetylase [Amphibacillus sp. MSJ-3]|uniref:delta-lactam-biosynthetic de-N-acetylase n=1 Tax=Amphibacillus sp. MSJ-3 TaxID=2841505 RepID=UPI0020A138C6|nr:delta-lactam-biosynthetic de-N-acetylase [Amphibacillus sp. MSJ-3]
MQKILKIMIILMICSLIVPNVSYAYGWGYKKGSNNQPPEVGKYGEILEQHGGYYFDPSGEKNIYLTFDNGYEAGYTEGILDVLQEEEVPATFFVTGHYVRSAPEIIKRIVDDGHLLGNHSYHHPDFTGLTKEKFKQELSDLDRAVEKLTGIEKLHYLRPPRGVFNEETIKWGNELGYIHMFWSLAFVDWHSDQKKGWESAYQQVVDQLHPGAIILLHTVNEDNAQALTHLIKEFKQQGYTFKSLDDLVFEDILLDPLGKL